MLPIRSPFGNPIVVSPKLKSRRISEALCLAVSAMATRFELVLPLHLPGPRPESLRAAGEAALAEIAEVENWLSVYRTNSPLAEINARASREPVRVAPPIFALLEQAREWSRKTGNAFDPTVGPLVQVWRELAPTDAEWNVRQAAARAVIGWTHIELDARACTVRFHRCGVQLDLGSIGKGWAMDRAVELLSEAGVTSALLHGGTSTIVAVGSPRDASGWRIELASAEAGESTAPPTVISLHDESLSVSATWGRLHRDPDGRIHGHVLDPRTGEPVLGPSRAAVAGPTATGTDVLSTALLVTGDAFLERLSSFGVGYRGWRS